MFCVAAVLLLLLLIKFWPVPVWIILLNIEWISSELFPFVLLVVCLDRLCGVAVRVPGYRSRGPGIVFLHYQIFWEVVGLELGSLSLVSISEELLEWKSSCSGSRKPRLMAVGIRYTDHALRRLRTKAQEFSFRLVVWLPWLTIFVIFLSHSRQVLG
jgi:hypothetical protein